MASQTKQSYEYITHGYVDRPWVGGVILSVTEAIQG
jgi:hypothetical protein